MSSNRPVGILAALLTAAQDGALGGLRAFTPEEVAPKLTSYLSANLTGRQLSQSLWYAKKKGFLATEDRGGLTGVVLTYKGRERLLSIRRQALAPARPETWDGKWRMVTFDIPERRRFARDTLRNGLKRMGFMKLEGSLWLFPYEARGEVVQLAETLLLKDQVRYFVVDSFDGEIDWQKRFNLSQTKETAA